MRQPMFVTLDSQARRLLVFAGIYGVLGVWIPFSFITPLTQGTASVEFWFTVLLLQVATFRLAMLAVSTEPRMLALTFYMFIYVWVGISGAVQIYVNIFPWSTKHWPEHVLPALIMIALSIAMYEVGRSLARSRLSRVVPEVQTQRAFQISGRAVVLVSLLAIPAALYGIAYFGGPQHLLSTRGVAAAGIGPEATKMSLLLARALLRTPSFVALVLCAYYCYVNWRGLSLSRKRLFGSLLLFLLCLNVITNFPPAQARYWSGTMAFTVLFILLPWRRWSMAYWVIALTVLLIWVYPRADVVRRAQNLSHAVDLLIQTDKSTLEHLLSEDFDIVQVTTNSIAYQERLGIMWGRNVAGALLFWFPRRLWHEKPIGTGHIVARGVGYRYINLSSPLWMEAFMALFWPGVVIWMLLYGYLAGWCDARFAANLRAGNRNSIACVAIPFWAAFQFFFLRGDLQVAFSHLLFALALFLITAPPGRPSVALRTVLPNTQGGPARAQFSSR